MNEARILLVEDEGITAMEFQRKLKFWGYDVPSFAFSKKEALQMAEEMRPDLVLMDIVLKGDGDGIEAAQKIKEFCDIPIIYITAYDDINIRKRALNTEPAAYMVKPFNDDDLHQNIEKVLHQNENEKKLLDTGQWIDQNLKDLNIAIIVTDAEGYVKFINNVTENLTGFDQSESLLNGLMEIFKVKKEKKLEKSVKNIISWNSGCLINRVTLITRDENEVPIEYISNPIFGDKGEFSGAVILFEDISNHRNKELSWVEQNFNNINLHAPQAIGLVNAEGEILDANEIFMELFGASNVSDLNQLDIFHDFKFHLNQANINNENIVRYEIKINLKEQKEFKLYKTTESGMIYLEGVFSTSINSKTDSQYKYLVYLQDITDNRLMEESLRKTEAVKIELETKNKSMEDQVTQLNKVVKTLNNDSNVLKKEFENKKIDFNERKEKLEAEIKSLKEVEEKLGKQIQSQKRVLLKLTEKSDAEILKYKEKEDNLQRSIDNLREEIKEKVKNFKMVEESLKAEAKENERIADQTDKALNKKEKILKTFQNQVRKDINMISSLSGLQFEYYRDEIIDMFKQNQNDVKSIAMVHENLYGSDDLERINFKEYVHNMINDLSRSYGLKESNVDIKINVGVIYLDLNTAVMCGLIINELVSNSLKYAFTTDESGKILIEINSKDDEIVMNISDNGKVLPDNFEINNNYNPLGLQLVKTLVNQMDGNIQYNENNGTHFTIRLKNVINESIS